MKTRYILFALLLTAVLAAPAPAMILGLNWGTGQSPVVVNYNGQSHTVYAGSLKAYKGGTIGNPLPPNDGTYFADVFCVDLAHQISVPTEYAVDQLTTAALTHGDRLAWLYLNHSAQAKNDVETAAALQIAMWDVWADNGDGLAAGNFTYQGGLTMKSNNLVTDMLATSQGHGATALYLKAVGPYGQSMIGPPVPEPGSFGLLGVGLGLVGLAFLRKRN